MDCFSGSLKCQKAGKYEEVILTRSLKMEITEEIHDPGPGRAVESFPGRGLSFVFSIIGIFGSDPDFLNGSIQRTGIAVFTHDLRY